jgi:fanconi anemia group I protein
MQSPVEASLLLEAIEPLFKTSPDLQDYAILILRKSMFSMDIQSREVALNGFLSILKVNTAARMGTSSGENSLDFEILGTIRRCFSQQSNVKKQLYEGLALVIEKKPQLIDTISGYLISHFFQFYKSSSTPIVLEKCVNSNTTELIEPLPHLLLILQKLDLNCPESDRESKNMIELKKIMNSLADRICESKLEDFDLDDSTEYSPATDEGKENQILGGLLCGVFQVVMEYLQSNEELESEEILSKISELYTNYSSLHTTILKKSKVKGKSKFDAMQYVPLLSLDFTNGMIGSFHSDDASMKGNNKFKMFVMELCEMQLMEIKKNIDGFKSNEKLFKTFSELSKMLLSEIGSEFENSEEDKKKKKTYCQYLAKNYNECFQIVFSLGLDYVLEWIESMFENGIENPNESINHLMKSFEGMIIGIIGTELFSEESKIFIDILLSLSVLLTDKSLLSDHRRWVSDICVKYKLIHLPLVKSIFKFYGSLIFSDNTIISV